MAIESVKLNLSGKIKGEKGAFGQRRGGDGEGGSYSTVRSGSLFQLTNSGEEGRDQKDVWRKKRGPGSHY